MGEPRAPQRACMAGQHRYATRERLIVLESPEAGPHTAAVRCDRRRRLIRRAAVSAILPLLIGIAGCAAHQPGPAGASTQSGVAVETMISGGSPFFSDPYPVYRTQNGTSVADPHIVFGTPKAALLCPGQLSPGCYRRTHINIQLSPALTAQAGAAGNAIVNTQNHNPFQEANGTWDMALTVSVRPATPPGQPATEQPKGGPPKAGRRKSHWTVILHVHPVGSADPVPTTWVADSVLEGSLAQNQRANYDGKYYETNNTLYLLYSKRLSEKPGRAGIVAQPMSSPAQPAASQPVVLLPPGPGAEFSSEDFFLNAPKSQFKLVETGNISQIDGKYVMAYSTGAFNENDYKTGLAWSSSFLPPNGSTYQKLVTPDPSNIWHNPGHQDINYLLQSQQPQWPNDVAGVVSAPGVPAIVEDNGKRYLMFAGYLPSTTGGQDPTAFDPSKRQSLLISLCTSDPASIVKPCTH